MSISPKHTNPILAPIRCFIIQRKALKERNQILPREIFFTNIKCKEIKDALYGLLRLGLTAKNLLVAKIVKLLFF